MPMLEAYGMTEASHQMASNPLPPARAHARLGRHPDRRRDPHRRRGRARRRRRRAGRGRDPRPGRDARLPRERRGERRAPSSTAGSAPATRARFDGRLPAARRAAQGDDHPRRREHLAVRGRGGAARRTRGVARPSASASRTRSTASSSARAVALERRRRGATLRRALPGAPRGVQGARASSTSSTRSRGRRPARCSGRAWPRYFGERRMRFAVLGAGAIGAYVGAALARGGADVDADRPRRAPRGDAARRRAGAQPARRLRGASARRPTTSPRSPTPTSSFIGAEGVQPAGARAADRRRCCGRDAAVIAGAERHPVVVLPVASAARSTGTVARERRPRRRRLARDRARGA